MRPKPPIEITGNGVPSIDSEKYKRSLIVEPKTLEYRKIGHRGFAKIRTSDNVLMWRTRSAIGGMEYSCPIDTCNNMEEFIEYARTQI